MPCNGFVDAEFLQPTLAVTNVPSLKQRGLFVKYYAQFSVTVAGLTFKRLRYKLKRACKKNRTKHTYIKL